MASPTVRIGLRRRLRAGSVFMHGRGIVSCAWLSNAGNKASRPEQATVLQLPAQPKNARRVRRLTFVVSHDYTRAVGCAGGSRSLPARGGALSLPQTPSIG